MTSPAVLRRRRLRLVLAVLVTLLGLGRLVGCGVSGDAASGPFHGRLLVYGRHALTAAQVATLRQAVRGPVTPVYGGELALATGRSDYPELDVQAFTVDPASYAAAVGTPELAGSLRRGVVLSRTGALLRKVGTDRTVTLLGGRRLSVSAVVDDTALGGYELASTSDVLGGPPRTEASYLLVADHGHPDRTAAQLRAALPGTDLRIEASTRNGLLSSADTVLTQAQRKLRFGEFAMRVDADGGLRIDPAWKRQWLVTSSLPQLGPVRCNRLVLGPLRDAMDEVTRRGLGSLVHTADFQREGGCWSPRAVRFGAGQLSSHAWGIAVDINVDDNPLGAAPKQDPRLVEIMARHGFSWGGLWLRPDGAHFEWTGALGTAR